MELPQFWLSEKDNIMLSGRIDWLEYLEETKSVHIIDFKTGKSKDDGTSLQLEIYHLLVHNCQEHPVEKRAIGTSSRMIPQRLKNSPIWRNPKNR